MLPFEPLITFMITLITLIFLINEIRENPVNQRFRLSSQRMTGNRTSLNNSVFLPHKIFIKPSEPASE